jgi:hypothetical protein
MLRTAIVVGLHEMAIPPRERQYITNWQLSIISAAAVHDLEFVRCLRLISRVMMPHSSPPIDLAAHARQEDYSDADMQALVVWIKVLEDMADTGDIELCRQFREVCTQVFASQGLPDMMANGPWVKPPPPRDGVEDSSSLYNKLAQITRARPRALTRRHSPLRVPRPWRGPR